uniref:Uncharacterized protein n=1 Tax=Timema poppense TaxID=170557 RepID=A0A7R9DEE9_TIMPO|nr:unnamed protein product [Timema poppensis]
MVSQTVRREEISERDSFSAQYHLRAYAKKLVLELQLCAEAPFMFEDIIKDVHICKGSEDLPMSYIFTNIYLFHSLVTSPQDVYHFHSLVTSPQYVYHFHSLVTSPQDVYLFHSLVTSPQDVYLFHSLVTSPQDVYHFHSQVTSPQDVYHFHSLVTNLRELYRRGLSPVTSSPNLSVRLYREAVLANESSADSCQENKVSLEELENIPGLMENAPLNDFTPTFKTSRHHNHPPQLKLTASTHRDTTIKLKMEKFILHPALPASPTQPSQPTPPPLSFKTLRPPLSLYRHPSLVPYPQTEVPSLTEGLLQTKDRKWEEEECDMEWQTSK